MLRRKWKRHFIRFSYEKTANKNILQDKDERNMMHILVLKGADLTYLSSENLNCSKSCFKVLFCNTFVLVV